MLSLCCVLRLQTNAVSKTCSDDSYAEPAAAKFKVRGPLYLTNKKKIQAAPSVLHLVSFDTYGFAVSTAHAPQVDFISLSILSLHVLSLSQVLKRSTWHVDPNAKHLFLVSVRVLTTGAQPIVLGQLCCTCVVRVWSFADA